MHCLMAHYYPAQPDPWMPRYLECFRGRCNQPGFHEQEYIGRYCQKYKIINVWIYKGKSHQNREQICHNEAARICKQSLIPERIKCEFFLNIPIIVQCRFSRLFYWTLSICTGDNLDKVGGREKAENKWHCYQGRGGCRGLLSIAQSREEPSNMFYLLSISNLTFFYCSVQRGTLQRFFIVYLFQI